MTEEQEVITENEEKSGSGDDTIKKHRSPNYPYIGLETALLRASDLQRVSGIHPVRVTTAWDTWDYKKGAGNQIVAALDAYGLIQVESGVADNRLIKLTMDARKILDNTSERPELLKKSALSPVLHQEIWDYFKGDLPPANSVIREYLVYQRNFNPSYVDKFIEQFRECLAFANVTKSDKIDSAIATNDDRKQEDNFPENDGKGGSSQVNKEGQQLSQTTTLPEGRIFKASIEVFENGKLDVVFAGSLNSVTVSLLKDIYDIKEKYEPKVIETKKETDLPLLENGS